MTKENSKVKPDATADKASPRTSTSKYKGKCIACGARGHWIGECELLADFKRNRDEANEEDDDAVHFCTSYSPRFDLPHDPHMF